MDTSWKERRTRSRRAARRIALLRRWGALADIMTDRLVIIVAPGPLDVKLSARLEFLTSSGYPWRTGGGMDQDQEPPGLQDVEGITSLDTARMTLRWALERLQALEKAKSEAQARAKAEEREKLKALEEVSASQKA